ncbi:MAG TPA: hypothetical protein VM120_28660 [Bryobacteraceae bacterium]|nr:hypothetical protein [Bryobacteraceae bacterium]
MVTHKHTIRSRDYLFLEVETDGVPTGLGEGSCPFAWTFRNKRYRLSRWRDGSVLMTAMAAVDIALRDIEGKRLAEPVWRLPGASAAKPLPVYYSQWDHALQKPYGIRLGGVDHEVQKARLDCRKVGSAARAVRISANSRNDPRPGGRS